MNEWRQLAEQFGVKGFLYYDHGQYVKAAEMFAAGLVISRVIGDRNREGVMLGNLGSVYGSLGQCDKAAEQYEAALEIAQEIGDRKGEGVGLGNLGIVYMNNGQYDEADEMLEAGLEIAREVGDRNGESVGLGNLGIIYTLLGQYNKAAEMLEAAFMIAREVGDRHGDGAWLGSLGNVYMKLGQYRKAAEMFEEALKVAQDIGDRNGEGVWLGNLGNVYIILGQYDKAAEMLEVALVITQEIGDRRGQGTRLGSIGNVFMNLGQYDKAAEKCEAALEIAQEIGDRNGEGAGLSRLGIIYMHLGQYDEAVEMLEASLVITGEIGDRNGEGARLGYLGNVYINLGQYGEAAEKYEAALMIAREIGDRNGEGRWLGSLGIVYSNLGQYDKAVGRYEAALLISQEIKDRQGEGTWLGNLGICHYFKSDNYQHSKKALNYLQESVQVFDDLWMNIKEDDQKVTFDDVNGSSSTFAMYLHSLYWNASRFKEALVTREQASSKSLELLLFANQKDTLAASDTLRRQIPSYVTLPPVANFEKIRNVAIQSKSAIIVYDLHVDGSILIWAIKSGTNNACETSLVCQKVPVKKEYKSLQYLVESTRRSLGARDRKHPNQGRNKDSESLPKMPMIGEDKPIANFNDSDLQAVEDALRKAQHGSIDGPTITMKNALWELYDSLILPIEGALVDEQRLTIIPFGDLFALPFAALQDQDGTHLIEKHILSFVPSVGTLVELEHNRRTSSKDKKGSTVIVGAGANLSGAREEAEKVHNIITNSGQERREVKKFIGKEATKEAVVGAMQSADIIHLATHGSKDGISLSGLTGEDVKLTMGEVQSLDLKGTKMVVLSTCDTFKGDLRTDGVVGITRSFLAAGSSTVIASLWPVNDHSTKEMMIRLYEFMFQKDSGTNNRHRGKGDDYTVDVSYALQQVMIGMLKEEWISFDIKQWAPFLVYGLSTSLDN